MKIITSVKRDGFLKIEDLCKNQIFIFKIKITKRLHNDFIKFSGDKSPLHTNKKFCKKNKFKKLVGHAFLLTSILSRIYGMYIPGGSELCLHQTCNFKKPYYVNDNLTYEIKVKFLNKNTKILILSVNILNQYKEIIFLGDSTLYLKLIK